MPSTFDLTVKKVREAIQRKGVLHAEAVRQFKRRHISVGPYRSAVGWHGFAMCVYPALPDGTDCTENRNADRVARNFVRLVGVERALSAVHRELRKREG
jgi:hypothetical protein